MFALLPALLLALFAAWSGSFSGAASFSGAVSGQAAVLAAAWWGRRRATDPLGLGRDGRLLLLALAAALAASWWASPVPRAGRVGLVLLPAFLLLPAAVARCWEGERGRRLGVRAVAVAVAAAALWSLGGWLLGQSPRAALPLGHHNLLAAWLVTLLPLAALPVRGEGGWRWGSAAAVLAAVAALVASRSLLGLAALAVQLLVVGWANRRLRPWALAAAAAVLASRLPRLAGLAAGTDPSLLARRVYLEAGWAGWLERPLLGWGPGSTPWTAGLFLRPVPGLNPPGEAVGQLHSLPLQLAYEGGLAALLLTAAAAGLFAWRRRREIVVGAASDPLLARAGLLGLLGAGVTALGDAWLAVPALPVAAGVAAGAALAGGRPARGEASPAPAPGRDAGGTPPPRAEASSAPTSKGPTWKRAAGRGLRRGLVPAYLLLAAVVLLPVGCALRHYEAARLAAGAAGVRHHLERASILDPAFPLYRARVAWYGDGGPQLARAAARDAPGVAALWLSAGVQGAQAGAPWAGEVLTHAQALDPLGGLAPFFRVVADPEGAEAPRCGARALVGEPLLAAARFWEGREPLLAAALDEVLAWPGVDPGWRQAMAARAGGTLGTGGATTHLRVRGETGAEPLSLHLFRRRPWGAEWFSVELAAVRLEGLDLPPATVLTSSQWAFPPRSCTPQAP